LITDQTISLQSDLRGEAWYIGRDANDYIHVNTTQIEFYLDGNLDALIQNNGDFHADGDVIAYSTTTSDRRLKDNITTIENALDKVTKLRGVEYDWNAGGRKGQHDLGVIAQEVEEIIPHIVREKELKIGEYKNNPQIVKTVDYEKLTAVLIEAVKELKTQLDELKNSK